MTNNFAADSAVMFYVDDVAAEMQFWQALGFDIFDEQEMMGYHSFSMKQHTKTTTTFTVFAKEFITQVSPEVAGNVPSIMFQATDLEALHEQITGLTETACEISEQPFPNFNFASPSGIYFAVSQAS